MSNRNKNEITLLWGDSVLRGWEIQEMAKEKSDIPKICQKYDWDMPEMYLRLLEIYQRYVWDVLISNVYLRYS